MDWLCMLQQGSCQSRMNQDSDPRHAVSSVYDVGRWMPCRAASANKHECKCEKVNKATL